MYRSRKSRNNYKQYLRNVDSSGCPFCGEMGKRDIIEKHTSCYVIKNKFPYTYWDQQTVLEHLMIIPKRHVNKLYNLDLLEKKEIFELIVKYEANGYDVFARGVNSTIKTVPAHQHTHLIKTSGKHTKTSLFLKKPYVLINN